jgi:hypothetical protein
VCFNCSCLIGRIVGTGSGRPMAALLRFRYAPGSFANPLLTVKELGIVGYLPGNAHEDDNSAERSQGFQFVSCPTSSCNMSFSD